MCSAPKVVKRRLAETFDLSFGWEKVDSMYFDCVLSCLPAVLLEVLLPSAGETNNTPAQCQSINTQTYFMYALLKFFSFLVYPFKVLSNVASYSKGTVKHGHNDFITMGTVVSLYINTV